MIHEWSVLIGVISGFLILVASIAFAIRALLESRLALPFARRRHNPRNRRPPAAPFAPPFRS